MLYSALLRVSSMMGVCHLEPASVFAHYICIVIDFAFGKITILLLYMHAQTIVTFSVLTLLIG